MNKIKKAAQPNLWGSFFLEKVTNISIAYFSPFTLCAKRLDAAAAIAPTISSKNV